MFCFAVEEQSPATAETRQGALLLYFCQVAVSKVIRAAQAFAGKQVYLIGYQVVKTFPMS